MTPHFLARYLDKHLGPRITVYLAGLRSPSAVRQWIKGNRMPRTLAQARLNGAYEAAKILIDAYGDETARSWFFGTSSQLEDEAPAYLLRRMKTPDEGRRIVIAARAFVTVA